MHMPDVEDGWIHGDILREEMVQKRVPALWDTPGGPVYADVSLETLLEYWRLVEQSTLIYLPTLTDDGLRRVVVLQDSPEDRYTVDGLLWHVMIHEMRHSAQIYYVGCSA
jgi:uncharacterized damage-inducible protein DinB